jgi:hypothetical protein
MPQFLYGTIDFIALSFPVTGVSGAFFAVGFRFSPSFEVKWASQNSQFESLGLCSLGCDIGGDLAVIAFAWRGVDHPWLSLDCLLLGFARSIT